MVRKGLKSFSNFSAPPYPIKEKHRLKHRPNSLFTDILAYSFLHIPNNFPKYPLPHTLPVSPYGNIFSLFPTKKILFHTVPFGLFEVGISQQEKRDPARHIHAADPQNSSPQPNLPR